MRWFFLFVLALNLSYISWHLLSEPAPYADVPPLKKDIERIVLLSERDSADSKQASSSTGEALQDQSGQDEKDGEKPAAAAAGVSEDKTSAGKASQSGSGPASASAGPLATDKQGKPAVAEARSESVQSESVPSEPTRSESAGAAQKATSSGAGAAATEQDMASKPEENCYTLGPFRDLDALRSLTRDIKSYVVSADFRGEEVNEQSLYWVFIRPVETEEQARKLAARLKDNKITDFYIIRKGDQKNGISLGRFRNKASAYGLAKKVSKLNFDVVVEPVFRNVTHYWLDYQLSKEANIPKAVFDKYIDGKSADFTRKSRVCP
jgi:hypothetical protein